MQTLLNILVVTMTPTTTIYEVKRRSNKNKFNREIQSLNKRNISTSGHNYCFTPSAAITGNRLILSYQLIYSYKSSYKQLH